MGVDQSMTSTGVVLLDYSGNVQYYEIVGTDSNNPYCDRIHEVAISLAVLQATKNVTHVVFEKPVFGQIKGNSVSKLLGLHHYLESFMESKTDADVVTSVNLSTIKKFATGNGRADKSAMIDSLPDDILDMLSAEYKKTTGLRDLADAYWIAKWQLEQMK
jgi:Holliday junction resolvasome RuvABC endonuclease subunit